MTDEPAWYEWGFIALALVALAGAFLAGLVDDTPDPYLFASLLGAAVVFAVARP